jgi:pyrimidine-nucleoside phosphorylase
MAHYLHPSSIVEIIKTSISQYLSCLLIVATKAANGHRARKLNFLAQRLIIMFNPVQVIAKKRDGETLNKDEITTFISQYSAKLIPDYQMSALLMAIYLKGMDAEETAALTDAMLYSGEVLSFNDSTVIDKHSTGGVGDKTSFILAPIAAAAGVKVPMIAGRGLGHTGGTVDKAEAIPGFKTELTLNDFKNQLLKNSIVMIGQTSEIAPADKLIYSLRDVTGTIECVPLITASIMSKKLAEGARGLVLDLKFGSGAFMQKMTQAKLLAKSITSTARRFNQNIMISITNMDRPLGNTIGHSLEILECIDVLKGHGPTDLSKLSIHLAGGMIHLAGIAKDLKSGIKIAQQQVENGNALKKFAELIELQGGDARCIQDYGMLPVAECETSVLAPKSGHIHEIQPRVLGMACLELGGGRKSKEDKIDLGVGIKLYKKPGDKVLAGDVIAVLYHRRHQKELVQHLYGLIIKAFSIKSSKPKLSPLIYSTNIQLSGKKRKM